MWLDRLRKMKEANQRIDQHEWSVEKIAIKSEVPKQTFEKIFSGSTKDPKLMTMQSLVYTLGYTLDDLFADQPLRGPGTYHPIRLRGMLLNPKSQKPTNRPVRTIKL